jgi:hypothetical protein
MILKIHYLMIIPLTIMMLCSAQNVYADRGIIPVKPHIPIYEPGQKAIIAWNGIEEIMILSTDVTATEDTMILEILPLPSKPKVEVASFESFKVLEKIVSDKFVIKARSYGAELEFKGLEVIFHEKIGFHDITVIKAFNADELVYWIEQFALRNSITTEIQLSKLMDVVRGYIDGGFQYYVVDLISLKAGERSIEPIMYRFNSSFIYYPLKISSMIPGETKITLFIITMDGVRRNHPNLKELQYKLFRVAYPVEVEITMEELRKVDPRIAELFKSNTLLTILAYEGSMSTLKWDFMATIEPRVNVNSLMMTFLTTTIMALALTVTTIKMKKL